MPCFMDDEVKVIKYPRIAIGVGDEIDPEKQGASAKDDNMRAFWDRPPVWEFLIRIIHDKNLFFEEGMRLSLLVNLIFYQFLPIIARAAQNPDAEA
jgi:hypothetical protein